MTPEKIIQPLDGVLAVTYKCNARCVMCDIWQLKNFPEMDLENYRKLPASLLDINISGGEVFMYNRLPELVKIIKERCPKAKIVLSSNGFMPEFIAEQMKKILALDPSIGVALSLDGVGDKHEEIRRIPEAFAKVMKTLELLQGLGMKNLRLAFTVLPQNVTHFSQVYDLARSKGVQFTSAFAQSSDHYFGGKKNENHPNALELKKQFARVIARELKTWNFKRWARAYFVYGLYKFGSKTEQILSDDAGKRFFFMDPTGLVYPSVVDNFIMGDLTEVSDWDELWQSERANEARKMTYEHGRPAWMICTARTAMKKRPFRVGWWVLKNKFGQVKL